jgi:beta-xylosidase
MGVGWAVLAFSLLQAQDAPEKPAYLFASFRDNGQDGLHLAYSRDGLAWTALKNDRSFLKPEVGGKLMRDPSICQGPDGMFHMVWTTGWWDKGIGLAHSKDLVQWSAQENLPVMQHEPTALNSWAPEIFYDEATGHYLIYWSTTIPGRFEKTEDSGDTTDKGRLNHRIYCVATPDFKAYSETRLLYDGGFNAIDAYIFKHDGRYWMLVKDETKNPSPEKNIRIATADQALGPYGKASRPFSPSWVEGPCILKHGKEWYVYFDAYTRGRYEGMKSADLQRWKDITDQLAFPKGTRHGSVLVVKEPVLQGLLGQ